MKVGYARVSTEEQDLSLQIDALKSAGCEKIFSDHGISGTRQTRPGLDAALASLHPGDKIVVWRLDRLGRSLIHLIQLLDRLGQRGIRFHSLNENIDTSSSGGRLVFHMMAALAEFERALISERTRAGMAAARAQGRHIGRPPSLTMEQCAEARRSLELGVDTLSMVAQRYGVHPRTLLRLVGKEAVSPTVVPREQSP
jgi:DNA invertase Pin-like site-specific DNA recombinase